MILIFGLFLDYFGSIIKGCSKNIRQLLIILHDSSNAEIDDLDVAIEIDYDVCRFQVSVHDVFLVEVS